MCEDEIEAVNEWFDEMKKDQDEYFQTTYHHTDEEDGEDLYVIADVDIELFTRFLNDMNPDMVCFPCKIGSDGIWFTLDDLKDATYR